MEAGNEWEWAISEGRVDPTFFFEILPDTFPEATTFFIEGSSIEKDVLDCYLRNRQPGKFLAQSGTLGPSIKIRCNFDKAMFKELALLSERHAVPELLDHLSVYKEGMPLLVWHDAFANTLFLPYGLSEERVAAFAEQLNLSYARENLL